MLEIKKYLETLGQSHLVLGLEALSFEQRDAFFQSLKKYGLSTLKKQKALLERLQLDISSCQPLNDMCSSGIKSDQMHGDKCIREGKVGCLILAGGQGTRLGCDGPKGMLCLSRLVKKSLFQLLCERVMYAGKSAERSLQLAIMTSPLNHNQTRAFFENHALFGLRPSQLHFFSQGMLPLLDEEGNWLLEKPGTLAEGPDGNGNALKCFYEQGLWAKWHNEGIEYVNIIFVDNLLADPFDREFIGFTIRNALDIGIKAVERLSIHEKMGVLVQDKGKIRVIEYSEFVSEASEKYQYASSGMFCFSMEFIRHLYENLNAQSPWHLARKTMSLFGRKEKSHSVPTSVFKCETFQFDLLNFTSKSASILFPRQLTYAPIKNAIGEKSPTTAREALLKYDREIYTQLSGLPAPEFSFELDPVFYYPSDAMKNYMKGRHLKEGEYVVNPN